jgi:hypothetical protein
MVVMTLTAVCLSNNNGQLFLRSCQQRSYGGARLAIAGAHARQLHVAVAAVLLL